MMGWYGEGAAWTWAMVSITVLLILGALVATGIALYRGLVGDADRTEGRARAAERLLDERLARGDIDVDEYRKRRDALRAGW